MPFSSNLVTNKCFLNTCVNHMRHPIVTVASQEAWCVPNRETLFYLKKCTVPCPKWLGGDFYPWGFLIFGIETPSAASHMQRYRYHFFFFFLKFLSSCSFLYFFQLTSYKSLEEKSEVLKSHLFFTLYTGVIVVILVKAGFKLRDMEKWK